MKKYAILLLVFMTKAAFPQNTLQTENLVRLAKVWGFMKYYHSSSFSGQVEWDGELIKLIPETDQSENKFKEILNSWYNALPAPRVSAQPTVIKADSIINIFGRKEIYRFDVGNALQSNLLHLYDFHLPDSNVYVTNRYKGYTLDFLLNTEEAFDAQDFPSLELRLLTLFRYWNIINYQYPFKHKIPKDWNKVLATYIPLFISTQDREEYRKLVKRLTAEMEDSHSFYQDANVDLNNQLHTSFELKYFKGRYFVGKVNNLELAAKEGIYLGDEIIKINGMYAKEYEKKYLFAVNGSNLNSKYRDFAQQLFKVDTIKEYEIVVRRGNGLYTLRISRYGYQQLTTSNKASKLKPLWNEVLPGIWYVAFCSIKNETELKELFTAIKDANGVIWDMRGYPTYSLLGQTFASLMQERILLGYNANADIKRIGQFIRTKSIYIPESRLYPAYTGKMVVLVDEYTQSLAESVSAQLALRPNTMIIGRQTAGTTGNVNYFNLPGGIKTSFTAVGFEGIGGSFKQKNGVKIAARVSKTFEEVQGLKDPILEQAIVRLKGGTVVEERGTLGLLIGLLRRLGLFS